MQAAAAARGTEELDELTFRRAQRGDERAWRDLVEHYKRPVHGLIWRLLAGRARHHAEDLTQETFVRVLKALPGFDLGGPASLLELINQSFEAMQSSLTQYKIAGYPPNVLVNIPRRACRFYEFYKAPELIRLGQIVARDALDRYEQEL